MTMTYRQVSIELSPETLITVCEDLLRTVKMFDGYEINPHETLSWLGLTPFKDENNRVFMRSTALPLENVDLDTLIDAMAVFGPAAQTACSQIEAIIDGKYILIEYRCGEVSVAQGRQMIEYGPPGKVLSNGEQLKEKRTVDVVVRLTVEGLDEDINDPENLDMLGSNMDYAFQYDDSEHSARIVSTEIVDFNT